MSENVSTDLHFFLSEANNRQGLHHNFPIILVTDGAESGTVTLNKKIKYDTTIDLRKKYHTHTHLHQVVVALRVPLQSQRGKQVVVPSIQELVEDVEVPLTVVLVHDARLLQQVVQDVTAYWRPLEGVTRNSRFNTLGLDVLNVCASINDRTKLAAVFQ